MLKLVEIVNAIKISQYRCWQPSGRRSQLISQPCSDALHHWMNIEEEEEVQDAVIEYLCEEMHQIVLTLDSGDEENDGESDELLKVLLPPFSKYCSHFETLESIAYSPGQLGVINIWWRPEWD